MKKQIVTLYAGTFDPITNGHVWVANEAASISDRLIVVVSNNSGKSKSMFSIQDRIDMVKSALEGLQNVEVQGVEDNLYTVDQAEYMGATHIIRGIRNEQDYQYEHTIRHINEDICPNIKSLYVMPPRHLSEISSSMIKGLVGFNGWVETVNRYVPPCVVKMFLYENNTFPRVVSRFLKIDENCEQLSEIFPKWYELLRKRDDMGFYHGMSHVKSCIRHLKKAVFDNEFSVDFFDMVIMALCYHDYVYDVGSKTNEEDSVIAFRNDMQELKNGLLTFKQSVNIDMVCQMILGTKNHEVNPQSEECIKYVCKIVNDIDLSCLGEDYQTFLGHTAAIRQEYSNYSDAEFLEGRKQFLLNLLNNPEPLFKTKAFSDLNDKAKDNMSRFIKENS